MRKRPVVIRATMLFLLLCVGLGSAQAQLKVDFGRTTSPVEQGFAAYTATHENPATFTTQSFEAFGSDIDITPTWAPGAVAACMQMYDRGGNAAGYSSDPADMDDLMRDWIGSDTRSAGNPLTLTISGLPKGIYSWLSYHHDTDGPATMGQFDVTINDASGSKTTNDIQVTATFDTTTIDGVAIFETTIVSNGADDVTLVFDQHPYNVQYNEPWFIMNGFVMERLSALDEAHDPNPSEGQTDVLRDAVLSWTPAEAAVAHDVYLGTNFADVNDATEGNDLGVLVSPGQDANMYAPAANLEYGLTYYWRVDEVNAPSSPGTKRGPIWSFEVEPYLYSVEDVNVSASTISAADKGPENVINGSGLVDGLHSTEEDEMWIGDAVEGEPVWLQFDFDRDYEIESMHVWNYNYHLEKYVGLGVNDVTVEYTQDGVEWVTLGNFQVPQAPGTTDYAGVEIDLGGIAARAIRLVILSNRGNDLAQYGLSEIRFNYFPTFSRYPDPADGATAVDVASLLNWRPGRDATEFKVNLGTDPNAVADGLAEVATVQAASYNPGMLALGAEYFWRIDDVNAAQTPTTWMSDVWSFSTPPYIVVDDFESYTDEPGEEVFVVWPDGYGISSNGSQVTYDNPPYMESTIVHSGSQSMPYHYGKNSATNSEATMTVGGANWTAGNAKTLVLYFRGDPDNDPAQLYVKIGTTRINYPGDPAGLKAPLWKQWNIDLTSVSASSVSSLTIGVDGPGEGLLYIDDIRLYNEAPAMPGPAVDPGTANLKAYYQMNNSLADASGNGLAGTAASGAMFGTGPAGYGQALTLDGSSTAYATIPVGPVVQASDSMTIATWVRIDTLATWARLFDFNNDTNQYMFFAPSNGSVARFAITVSGNGAESQLSAGSPIPGDGNWHHVAVTIDGTASEMSMYIDGTLADSGTTDVLPSDLGNTVNNYISRSAYENDPYLTGAVDEFRIYDRALSGAEIRYLLGDR